MRFSRLRGSVPPSSVTVDVDGSEVPVAVRVNARARRISLRPDPETGGARLTLPRGVPVEDGLDFVREKAAWLRNRLGHLPPRVPFAPGVVVPYLGEDHTVTHRPDARRGVWRENGAIHVSGAEEHLPRRLTDWFRAEARRTIAPRAQAKAGEIGETVARVTIRDTRSRWASCSSRASLNFSWRLVMAPEPVLDYVVAHEVAHLVEMNHSPDFWALVARLDPNHDSARRWLKRHGGALHRYG